MIALNHSFVDGIARRNPDIRPLELLLHVKRRTRVAPLVHQSLVDVDTGDGPFIKWANKVRKDPRWSDLVELLLRVTSGPFLDGEAVQGPVQPPLNNLAAWLEESIRLLLGAKANPGAARGLLSPTPTGGADSSAYAHDAGVLQNWRSAAEFDATLTSLMPRRTTLEVLKQAESEMDGQLVLLPSAIRSAELWARDCSAEDLHRALLGLEHYAAQLVARAADGSRVPREVCAQEYHRRTGVEISQESSDVWKRPMRRRQRLFRAGAHGEQYFDMHAKPGQQTRVHIWVYVDETGSGETKIYVGHCGRHLT